MNHTGTSPGFTLIELVVTLAIVGIVTAMVAPSFSNLVEKQHLLGATELFYRQVIFARNEAIKRSRPIYFTVAADGSPSWSFGITDRPGGCNPAVLGADDADSCSVDQDNDPDTGDRILYRFTSDDYPGVSLTRPSFVVPGRGGCAQGLSSNEICFDPVRGTARSGSFRLNTNLYAATVVLHNLGRARFCTPRGPKAIPDYPKCN